MLYRINVYPLTIGYKDDLSYSVILIPDKAFFLNIKANTNYKRVKLRMYNLYNFLYLFIFSKTFVFFLFFNVFENFFAISLYGASPLQENEGFTFFLNLKKQNLREEKIFKKKKKIEKYIKV